MFEKRQPIWILEDDKSARFVYDEVLKHRYTITYFKDLASLEKVLENIQDLPRLLIADITLPDGCFLHFIASSPKIVQVDIPFVVVSSLDDVDALRFCFDEGALDYITKPFKKSELIVKIERAILNSEEKKKLSGPKNMAIFKPIFSELTAKENAILSLFKESTSGEVTRDEIVTTVWENLKVHPKTLDVHLYNLRRKLQAHGLKIALSHNGKWRLLSDRMDG